MKRSPGPRKTANLSDSLHQRLNAYALAASAAGIGVLALSPSAEAKIVYTPAHVQISHFGIFPFPLDVNNDGITDFIFPTGSLFDSGFFAWSMAVSPAVKGNRVWGTQYASALKAGIILGNKGKFINNGSLSMGYSAGTSHGWRNFRGLWENKGRGVKNRYLGLKFIIQGKTHFGWARINFTNAASVILTGYAYETIPNKPIITGQTKGSDLISAEEPNAALTTPTHQPATLGALASGAPGMSIWRRMESAAGASN